MEAERSGRGAIPRRNRHDLNGWGQKQAARQRLDAKPTTVRQQRNIAAIPVDSFRCPPSHSGEIYRCSKWLACRGDRELRLTRAEMKSKDCFGCISHFLHADASPAEEGPWRPMRCKAAEACGSTSESGATRTESRSCSCTVGRGAMCSGRRSTKARSPTSAFDLRGHGMSEAPLEVDHYTGPRRRVDDVQAVIEGLGPEFRAARNGETWLFVPHINRCDERLHARTGVAWPKR